jgi:nucleotide-binding universal stress UspA family protein
MKDIKTIMACVDLSPYSLEALEYAISFAKGFDAKLIVFNVINQRDISSIVATDIHFTTFVANKCLDEKGINELKVQRRENIETLLQKHFSDARSMMDLKIETGNPGETIIDAVGPLGVDMVVMANKGRGNISRFLHGSIAEKVFRHCPVPIVSVRSNLKRASNNK